MGFKLLLELGHKKYGVEIIYTSGRNYTLLNTASLLLSKIAKACREHYLNDTARPFYKKKPKQTRLQSIKNDLLYKSLDFHPSPPFFFVAVSVTFQIPQTIVLTPNTNSL